MGFLSSLKRLFFTTESIAKSAVDNAVDFSKEKIAAGIDIVGGRAQHLLRVGVANRKHVPMEMHRGFRRAGGAGCESNQRNVVMRGGNVLERLVVFAHQGIERCRIIRAEKADIPEKG